jgi:hypothetical protein
VIWARTNVAVMVCPKSFITAQSLAWVEEYLVRRKLGQKGIEGLGAREVEAFLILEHELAGALQAHEPVRGRKATAR